MEGEGNAKAPCITVRNVSKYYKMGGEVVKALDDVSFDIYKGEICCIIGTSGSGKSTLLNMMAGLEKPTKGEITIKNARISKMNEKKLALFRQRFVGFIFQSYNLLQTLTALENVTLPLIFSKTPKRIRNKKAYQMLTAVGLEKRHKHKPNQMSGGQQQRVSIARAFINNPEVVFADEPTGNLDTKTTDEMMRLMVDMAGKNSQTLVIVTHDLEIACYATKIIKIKDGVIESITENAAEDTELEQEILSSETREMPINN